MSAFRTVFSFVCQRRLGLALALFVTAASAASAQPVLGERATQRLSFVYGPNLVSLRVYPQDRSLQSILGPHRSKVLLVKDIHEAVYAPRHGIHKLKTWPWDEALMVFALEPFTLDVTGAEISLESTLALESGWSWIPYLADAGETPQQAFSSLGSAFSKVEDFAGRAFPPAGDERLLESMVPGAGYRVRLSAAGELAYPAPASAITVESIADAIALQGLVPGQRVVVSDPVRGGTFVVRDSGAPSDGGTVFVPTEFTEETRATGLDGSQTLFDGPNDEGVVFDSFRLFYGPDDDDFLDATALHGHASGRGDDAGEPLLNTRTGRLLIPSGLRDLAKSLTGSNKLKATYQYATSALRLERTVEPIVLEGRQTTDYVRPEWWGDVPYPAGWTPDESAPPGPRTRPSGIVLGDPVYDATDGLATAINAAEVGAAKTGRQHYVVLAGMYGYARVIEMQDQVVLKGEQDGVRDGQGLRVLKGAPWHYWAVKENHVDPSYFVERSARDRLMVSSDPFVVVRHGRQSQLDRVVDVELDGNLVENDYVFSNDFGTASGGSRGLWGNKVEEMLQNTSHWNGFAASHTHADTKPGSNAKLENVHIHEYGGNLVLGLEPVHFGGSRDLKLGNTIKNHNLYRVFTAPGTTIDNIEIYGYSWSTYLAFQQGHYRNILFHNLSRNPIFGFGDREPEEFIAHRNDAIPEDNLFNFDASSGYYYGDTATIENVRFEMSEDFRPRSALVGYDDGPLLLTNVTVDAEGSDPVRLASGGGQGEIDRSLFSLQNLTVESGQVQSFSASSPLHSRVSHIAPEGYGGTERGGALNIYPYRAGHSFTLYDVGGGQDGPGMRAAETVKIRIDDPDATADVFIQRAHFTGVDFPVMAYRTAVTDDIMARFRVFWRDVKFNRWKDANNDGGRDRESGRLQYFERATAWGRASEAAGALSSAALKRASDGTRYVDVDPEMFYAPQDPSYVTVTGRDAGRFLRWENVGDKYDPVLRLSFSGTSRVTVNWEAAIRPIPDGVVFPE